MWPSGHTPGSARVDGASQWAGSVVAVVVLLLVAGCGSRGGPAADGTGAPAASGAATGNGPAGRAVGSADAAGTGRGQDRAAAVAYLRFWTVTATLTDLPAGEWWARLATVAADPLLTDVYDGLRTQQAEGRRDYGTVMPHPTIVASTAGQASVVDCQDASRSGELDVASGLPVSTGKARTPLAGTVMRGRDGRWRVSQLHYLDSDC